MPNTIRIKRRLTDSTAPSTLQSGELAYNEVDNRLHYGAGNNGSGVATSIIQIAGSGTFVGLAGTQTITGNKTFSGTVSLGSSATATTPAGSSNDTTVATTAFVKGLGLGTGSVTSVALSLPSFITVTGSPITASGTLTGTLASQTANHVFIAPNGSAGAPTFRALAAADIPTLTASKISDFQTTVNATKLNALAAPDGDVSLNLQKITSLATPTAATDAATKGYVDSTTQGLDVKTSCRVATTANITLSGTQTIDGISVVAGNRVLVKNQTTASQNGIYVVAAGAWSRSDDASNGTKLHGGAFTFIEEGSTNADSGWVMTTDGTITIDTTAINWSQFSGAGQIDAGNGLTKTGNTLAVGTADVTRIVVNADNIDLATVSRTNPSGSATSTFVSGVTTDSYGRVTTVTTATVQSASTSQLGIVQLSNSTSDTSTSTAATAAAVKSAYDLANGGLSKSGGTMTGKLTVIAPTTSLSSLNIPSGTAPTSPGAGDTWATGGELYHADGTKTNKILYADFSNTTTNLSVAKGGTGNTTLTASKVLKANASANQIVAAVEGTDFVQPGVATVGKIIAAAATTSAAGFLLTAGTAPTSPASGDVWNTGTTIQFRDNASGTKTIAFTDSNITGTASGLSSTLAVGSGGTGATTLTGYVKGNGTSAMTAAATIPNTDITGLGTMSTQASSNVNITGGTIDGITIDGGTY